MPIENISSDFLSLDNFKLAWERVLRSQHAETKDRVALRSFASTINHSLEQLIHEIKADTYIPSSAPKIYVPKAARTLRPFPLLTVRDRIVYQAIGNLIIREASTDLSIVADHHVFAHLPQSNTSVFSLKKWQRQFRLFVSNYERIWKQGHKWVVEADVSAFYASIDHGLLLELIKERWVADDKFLNLLQSCLRKWTAHEQGLEFNHGIPQGYEISDLLATLFLLPVDESLVTSYRYLRYVDDIRVLSPDVNTASKALVRLDLELQKRALILQTKKTALTEITSLQDEKDTLQRKLSQINIFLDLGLDQQDELKELFFEAWNDLTNNLEGADSTLAFCLYRLDADTTVRNIAIRLLEILPWRSAIINKYLERFPGDQQTIQALIDILHNHKVYSWHLAKSMNTLAKIAHPNSYRDIALTWIEDQNLHWYQRLAAVEAVQFDQDSYAALSTAILHESNEIVKSSMIIACAFQAKKRRTGIEIARLIRLALEDDSYEVQLLGIWLRQQFPEITWAEINFSRTILGALQQLVPELAVLSGGTPCFIKRTLRETYEVTISEALDFTSILRDYEGCVSDLKKAVSFYHTDPGLYIGLINSFNHRLAIAIKPLLGSTIPNEQFANMVQSREFISKVPQLSLTFRQCNDTRNRTTGFHPYASALGTWSPAVNHPEKNKLHKGLKLAYQEFVDIYQGHLGIT